MAKPKLIPLADRVVVEPVTEKKTLSGIIIPDAAGKERPERGTMITINKKIVELKVGDEIMFTKYGPEEVKVDGLDYYILREDQILAIIK
jgi:chaperonin GroES